MAANCCAYVVITCYMDVLINCLCNSNAHQSTNINQVLDEKNSYS
jgi:predicted metal-dependent peptidase